MSPAIMDKHELDIFEQELNFCRQSRIQTDNCDISDCSADDFQVFQVDHASDTTPLPILSGREYESTTRPNMKYNHSIEIGKQFHGQKTVNDLR